MFWTQTVALSPQNSVMKIHPSTHVRDPAWRSGSASSHQTVSLPRVDRRPFPYQGGAVKPTDPSAEADALLRQGRGAEAVALVEPAAAAGDITALLTLATWRLMGQPLPRDLPEARRLLRRAADLGSVPAAVMEVALTANGSGAPVNWGHALALLRAAAARDGVAAAHLALVEAMSLDADGAPAALPSPEALTSDGAVLRFPGLLTPAECEHVARSAVDLFEPAVVVDSRTGREIRHPHRTSDGAVLGPTRESLPVRAINRRIAAVSGTEIDQGESLTVLRYAPGPEFRPHFDALPRTGNQRVKTVLIYLNQGFEGGETTFPRRGLVVLPTGGDAILFTNTLPDGRPDPRALHAGAPVTAGVKWLATRWIRARPFSVWTGPDGG